MCASIATYAVPASKFDGEICDIVDQAGMPLRFRVTSTQCAAALAVSPSLVYQILPSLVPAQISPRWRGEGAIAHTTSPSNWPRLSPSMPPLETMREGSWVERSGLNSLQESPWSEVFSTIWQP